MSTDGPHTTPSRPDSRLSGSVRRPSRLKSVDESSNTHRYSQQQAQPTPSTCEKEGTKLVVVTQQANFAGEEREKDLEAKTPEGKCAHFDLEGVDEDFGFGFADSDVDQPLKIGGDNNADTQKSASPQGLQSDASDHQRVLASSIQPASKETASARESIDGWGDDDIADDFGPVANMSAQGEPALTEASSHSSSSASQDSFPKNQSSFLRCSLDGNEGLSHQQRPSMEVFTPQANPSSNDFVGNEFAATSKHSSPSSPRMPSRPGSSASQRLRLGSFGKFFKSMFKKEYAGGNQIQQRQNATSPKTPLAEPVEMCVAVSSAQFPEQVPGSRHTSVSSVFLESAASVLNTLQETGENQIVLNEELCRVEKALRDSVSGHPELLQALFSAWENQRASHSPNSSTDGTWPNRLECSLSTSMSMSMSTSMSTSALLSPSSTPHSVGFSRSLKTLVKHYQREDSMFLEFIEIAARAAALERRPFETELELLDDDDLYEERSGFESSISSAGKLSLLATQALSTSCHSDVPTRAGNDRPVLKNATHSSSSFSSAGTSTRLLQLAEDEIAIGDIDMHFIDAVIDIAQLMLKAAQQDSASISKFLGDFATEMVHRSAIGSKQGNFPRSKQLVELVEKRQQVLEKKLHESQQRYQRLLLSRARFTRVALQERIAMHEAENTRCLSFSSESSSQHPWKGASHESSTELPLANEDFVANELPRCSFENAEKARLCRLRCDLEQIKLTTLALRIQTKQSMLTRVEKELTTLQDCRGDQHQQEVDEAKQGMQKAQEKQIQRLLRQQRLLQQKIHRLETQQSRQESRFQKAVSSNVPGLSSARSSLSKRYSVISTCSTQSLSVRKMSTYDHESLHAYPVNWGERRFSEGSDAEDAIPTTSKPLERLSTTGHSAPEKGGRRRSTRQMRRVISSSSELPPILEEETTDKVDKLADDESVHETVFDIHEARKCVIRRLSHTVQPEALRRMSQHLSAFTTTPIAPPLPPPAHLPSDGAKKKGAEPSERSPPFHESPWASTLLSDVRSFNRHSLSSREPKNRRKSSLLDPFGRAMKRAMASIRQHTAPEHSSDDSDAVSGFSESDSDEDFS